MFNRKPYRFKRRGHSVFVEWLKPIEQWSDKTVDEYLSSMRKHVQASVDESAWSLVGVFNPSQNPAYMEYVKRVRDQLIEEYGLHDIQDEVETGTYHLGLIVLSWPSDGSQVYPYYYRGVQLKPFRKAEEPDACD